MFTIAIPLGERRLTTGLKFCKEVAFIDTLDMQIEHVSIIPPPLIDPWLLPHWLQEHGVDIIIAEDMSAIALSFFQKAGIKVITGVPSLPPDEIVIRYLKGHLFK